MSTGNAPSINTVVSGTRQSLNGRRQLTRSLRPARQLRRIFREQACNAVQAVRSASLGTENVHEARKYIKRARATLRLLRSAIGEGSFAREDRTLKAAADRLGAMRDSEVAVQTMDELIQRCRSARTKSSMHSRRVQLQRIHVKSQAARGTSVPRAVALLERAATRSRDWTVSDSWYSPIDAVERLYRKARRYYRQAIESADDKTLHSLRKRTQYLRNALDVLALQPSNSMQRLKRRLSRLAELSGEDHDLAMLQATLLAPRLGHSQAGLDAILSLVEQRRTGLQSRVLKHAARLFRRKPGHFSRKLDRHRRRSKEASRARPTSSN